MSKYPFRVKYIVQHKKDYYESEVMISKEEIEEKLKEDFIGIPNDFPIWEEDYVKEINERCETIEYESYSSLEDELSFDDCWNETLKKSFLGVFYRINTEIYNKYMKIFEERDDE